ncbi:hypothetical protein GCM10023261_07090 [Bartonella jaculi]|uniref:Uncharacterized protein n=1 Tax=Bartonella jaculi TaxID=686226 RepID=A0ABP9N577_9HYPH
MHALRDWDDFREHKDNLNHKGECGVGCDTCGRYFIKDECVFGNGKVYGDAEVLENFKFMIMH